MREEAPVPNRVNAVDDLHPNSVRRYTPFTTNWRRTASRRRAALGAVHRFAAKIGDRTNWRAAGNAPSGASAKTASPTTFIRDPLGKNRPWAIDPSAAADSAEEWRYHRSGHHAARRTAESAAAGYLRRAAADFERRSARAAALCQSGFSAAAGRHAGARSLPASSGGGSGAFARRPVVGAGGPHAGAFGQRLRAGKPHHRGGRSARCFSHSNVRRLAPFFRAQRDALLGLAERTTRRWCC